MAPEESYRLPGSARPTHYVVDLEVDLERARFKGEVDVTVEVDEPTRALVLNSADLVIASASITTPAGERLAPEVAADPDEQQLRLGCPSELPAGTGYHVRVAFEGELSRQLRGFYLSEYTAADGVVHRIAATQFEPADARRAFPCWDEPAFKATFAIRVVVPGGVTALSNQAAASVDELEGGARRFVFHETMVMSTYLVAFVVGPFELSDPREVDGVPIRVASVPGRTGLSDFALEAGGHALSFLSGYFGIPYPASKLDHVAIPDFAFGAMENLGCVTYRENALLVDPSSASQLELQRVATVIAHETAHMWFGDLVTMKWWDGIWLNEAFATFMELTTTHAFNPDWEVWAGFGAGKAAALATDGLRATRPVEFAVGRPEEAEAMFDVLTYQKGGAVLRMLEQYLGPEVFRAGISSYLERHAYANTETADLWKAIEGVSGEPVTAMMGSWIGQRGHPLVSVEETADPSRVVLRQRRFLYSDRRRDGGSPGGDGQLWSVPVNLRASVGGRVVSHRVLLDGESAELDLAGEPAWLVVNEGAWGFYRVTYSQGLRQRLRDSGVREVLDPLERFALVADTWATVVAGTEDLRAWVDVARSLAGDQDPDVWAMMGACFDLLSLTADGSDREALVSFVGQVARPTWEALGWEPGPGEPMRAATARARVLGILGLVGQDPALRKEASKRSLRSMDVPSALAPDLVSASARILVAAGGENEWEAVASAYSRSSNPQDKLRYLFALAESTEPELLSRTLEMCLSPRVRSQDAPFLVAAVLGQPAGTKMAWEWTTAHWDDLVGRLPAGLVARVLEGISSVVDPALAAGVHEFCSTHRIPMAGPRIDQLLERMDVNVSLAGRLRGTLRSALTG